MYQIDFCCLILLQLGNLAKWGLFWNLSLL
jgi:hypothetical protein